MPKPDRTSACVRWKTFFHVTHEFNEPGIRKFGIDPTLATGLASRVWLCDLPLLPWAIKHVCTHHGWQIGDVKVLRVTLPRDLPVRRREGVYTVNARIPPKYLGFSLRYSIQE
jgi:hypothetical protein